MTTITPFPFRLCAACSRLPAVPKAPLRWEVAHVAALYELSSTCCFAPSDLVLGATSRDPARYAQPDTLDIATKSRRRMQNCSTKRPRS